MKRKLVMCLLMITAVTSLGACGVKEGNAAVEKESVVNVQEEKPTSRRDLPEGDYCDTGTGTFNISTSGGDSANGNIPVIFVSGEEVLYQIGYDAEEFDSSHVSYIYVDGVEVDKDQLGEAQGTITLSEDMLSIGIHPVEVVQYSTDSTDSEIITYKSCQYEVKAM